MSDIPPLTTTLGRTVHDEHFFRGHASLRNLLGAEDYWTLVSLAVDGPVLDELQCRVADAIAAAFIVADPRLWLFKAGRLVASYGNTLAGLAAGQIVMNDSLIGTPVAQRSVQVQIDIDRRIGDDYDDPDAVSELVDEMIAEGQFLHGFGVPGRPRDERAVALEAWYQEHGRTESRYWRLYQNLKRAIYDAKGLKPHIGGTNTPMFLEMGFDARQTMYMSNAMVVINTLSNAYDGEVKSLETYRKLPDAALEYTGRASRTSPRARAASQ